MVSYVKEWHLFTLDHFKTIPIFHKNSEYRIIPDSLKIKRLENDEHTVEGFDIDSGEYKILSKFDGPGKMKKAKAYLAELKIDRDNAEFSQLSFSPNYS